MCDFIDIEVILHLDDTVTYLSITSFAILPLIGDTVVIDGYGGGFTVHDRYFSIEGNGMKAIMILKNKPLDASDVKRRPYTWEEIT